MSWATSSFARVLLTRGMRARPISSKLGLVPDRTICSTMKARTSSRRRAGKAPDMHGT